VITEQSKQNIESAFHKAIRTNLVRDTGDVCEIAPAVLGKVREYSADKLLFITLSSFVFRLLIIFRIVENPSTLQYFVRAGAARTLDEVFAELANMCSGALNRELSASFPHLAMSTPYSVSGHCIAFLSELKPQHVYTCRITINDSVQLHATLCLCCSAPIEVGLAAATELEESAGELELF
jgi:hypothetical protein